MNKLKINDKNYFNDVANEDNVKQIRDVELL